MTEDYNMDKMASYYGKPGDIIDQIGPISHMPLFFGMIEKFPVGAQSIATKAGADIVELVRLRVFTRNRQCQNCKRNIPTFFY